VRNDSVQNGTFSWTDILTTYASGYYTYGIRVYAANGTGETDFYYTGYSGNFTIDHTAPNVTGTAITSSDGGYFYTTSTLTCSGTYADMYGAGESGSTFAWFEEGVVIVGQTTQIFTGTLTDTNTYICEYTPSDGYNIGTAGNSSIITASYSPTTDGAISCRAVQTTVYAGFALIAVGIIVLAGFMIIQLFKGDMGGAEVLIAVIIGAIAIGVILLVGYVVIDKVGASVCTP